MFCGIGDVSGPDSVCSDSRGYRRDIRVASSIYHHERHLFQSITALPTGKHCHFDTTDT